MKKTTMLVSAQYQTRAERLIPKDNNDILVRLSLNPNQTPISGRLQDISASGASVFLFGQDSGLIQGTQITQVQLEVQAQTLFSFGPGTLQRLDRIMHEQITSEVYLLRIAFASQQTKALAEIRPWLSSRNYVRTELSQNWLDEFETTIRGEEYTIRDFYRKDSPNLFAKCEAFHTGISDMQQKCLYQALYRVTITSALDNRVSVFNPMTRREEEMIYFDSNSYLGLHRHPRVLEATRRALDEYGYGTASSQLLGGTTKILRELEETLCRYHDREDAIIFSSGYAANLGSVTALIRENDLVVRDKFSHASIHDGALASCSGHLKTYAHQDMKDLERILAEAHQDQTIQGKLLITDGVFSMHGVIANLPALSSLAKQYQAKLMIDDAHGTGVIGPQGRGIEDFYGMKGAADMLMGTFSKAPGTTGGYVCGDHAVIEYLRFYARSGIFTAALPAALCAGVAEAFRVMEREPEHRQRLHRNTDYFLKRLKELDLIVGETQSPIVTVFMGSNKLLWLFSRCLFDAGVKCGNVAYPAVGKNETILRFSINARHTQEDLDRTIEILDNTAKLFNIKGRSKEEMQQLDQIFSFGSQQK